MDERNRSSRISSETPLLAELLRENGYRTFGFVNGGYVGRRFGFPRGFEKYEDVGVGPKRKGIGATRRLIAKARRTILSLDRKQPFFVFFHTFDIHCPYTPPEPYYSMFNSPETEKVRTNLCGRKFANYDVTDGQRRYLSDRYDGGVRWVDDALQELSDIVAGLRTDEPEIEITTDREMPDD